MRLAPFIAATFLITAMTGCEPAPDTELENDAQSGDTAAEQASTETATVSRQEIERINEEHIDRYNQDDVAGFTEVYTEDARLYPPGQETLEGREAIQEFWQAGHDQAGIRDVSLTTEEFEAMGDQAWEVGTASYTTDQGPVESRYMVIWQRGPDGEWRWHRDLMSPGAGDGQ